MVVVVVVMMIMITTTYTTTTTTKIIIITYMHIRILFTTMTNLSHTRERRVFLSLNYKCFTVA